MMDLTCKLTGETSPSNKMISNDKSGNPSTRQTNGRPAKSLFSIRDLVKCDNDISTLAQPLSCHRALLQSWC
ncbi:unnamed protein product [Allacma fusca]|uniref:Uncharacterized protein n=1 Tax=Allacma fusca TaxID=39272 RepID=A0A8J2KA91_9HEXA|nr:unnamed protein product [Allacma fusca]